MNVLILAGGFSTRLYPLTKTSPKALLPLAGKPIVNYAVDQLISISGLNKWVLVSNHVFVQSFSEWKDQYYPGQNIYIIDNGVRTIEERLGAVGDILFALEHTQWNEDMLVIASDTVSSLRFNNFLDFFKTHRWVANAVYKVDDTEKIKNRLGCVIKEGDKIVDFIEKPENPPSLFTSIPYYIFSKETLQFIKEYGRDKNNSLDTPGSLIAWMVKKTTVFAYDIGPGYYFDVGTIETYESLKRNDIFLKQSF